MSTRRRNIAIIGGGPGGLVSAREFLTTQQDGVPSFDRVVVFEQKDRVGGVWAFDPVPNDLDEQLLQRDYWDPKVIHPVVEPPSGIENASFEHPLNTEAINLENQWAKSGIYPHLYTNVAKRFMRFSSIPFNESEEENVISPLLTHKQVYSTLYKFAEDNKLFDHIRLQTQVHSVEKSNDKWNLVLRHRAGDKDEWYSETFDAIVVATGHYSTPYIPHIPGLETREAGSVSHSKSFRDVQKFEGKTVVIVGSSLSGIDIVQYVEPVAKRLIISRTPGKKEIYPWLERAADASETKPRIKNVNGKTVTFNDGTTADVDHILIATGYHWHWPFIGDKFMSVGDSNQTPTSASRVPGLYYNLFSTKHEGLGFIGVTLGATKFHSLEAGAASLAGVWSGAKQLPSKEEQLKWETDRVSIAGNGVLFHYYHFNNIKRDWFDEVIRNFAVPGRINPLDNEDITDMDRAIDMAEKLYFGVKSHDELYSEFQF
uniref:Flavin-containing monooxygenase n=1 Tax=Cyberlindnera americana TaxID=36016 RepID=A0A5P8N9P0_9ASCO|nr:flavin-containing monooxygenase [Cyberlindnera americana]